MTNKLHSFINRAIDWLRNDPEELERDGINSYNESRPQGKNYERERAKWILEYSKRYGISIEDARLVFESGIVQRDWADAKPIEIERKPVKPIASAFTRIQQQPDREEFCL